VFANGFEMIRGRVGGQSTDRLRHHGLGIELHHGDASVLGGGGERAAVEDAVRLRLNRDVAQPIFNPVWPGRTVADCETVDGARSRQAAIARCAPASAA